MTCSKKGACGSCSCASNKIAPRQKSTASATETTRLWPTEAAGPSYASTSSGPSQPLPVAVAQPNPPLDGCGKPSNDSQAICCQALKAADQTSWLSPDVARDIIIGLSDGLTVPFALTAGLSGTNSSRIVVLAGLAELVSGAISMGVGGFLSAQAEVDTYRYRLAQTRERMRRSCSAQIHREVSEILEPYGVPHGMAARVAEVLAQAETESRGGNEHGDDDVEAQQALLSPEQRTKSTLMRFLMCLPRRGSGSSALSADRSKFASTSHTPEAPSPTLEGISEFLLRIGEGLEPVSPSRIYISALVIGTSYFLGGIIPLAPYLFLDHVWDALLVSSAVTGVVLLLFGVMKVKVTGAPPSTGVYVWGAISTLAVGAAAAAASFAIVRALEAGK